MAPQSDARTLYVLVSSLAGAVLSLGCHLDLRCALRAADSRLRETCHARKPVSRSLPRLCYRVASDLVCDDWLFSFVMRK